MTKFSFAFQKILEINEKQKEVVQQQMVKAIKYQEGIQKKCIEVGGKLDRYQSQLKEKQGQGISINELRTMESYIQTLRERLWHEQSQLAYAEQHVQQKQNELQAKWAEVKKWSLLKERKQVEHQQRMKIEEENEINDLTAQRYHRFSS